MEEIRKKTKVLFVITKGNFGGAQRYVFDLATHLPQENFDISVAMGESGLLNKKLDEHNIQTIEIKSLKRDVKIGSDIAAMWELFQLFKKYKPDIVHLNSSKVGLLGALAARFLNLLSPKNYHLKTIFTGHGWAFNEDRGLISKMIFTLGHYITIILSDITIAVSHQVQNQISLFPFIKNKVRMIHNGIDTISFESKEEARLALGIESNAFVFGTISELHKNKGIDIALKSFVSIARRYPHTEYVVIGGGEEEKNLKQLAKSLEIEKNVRFIGYKDQAYKYLKAFDVFILSSRTEAFPYVILEAGSAGLPIIASRVGGIPEVIKNKQSGLLVEPSNTFDLEYSMHELIRDEEQRLYIQKNVESEISQKFRLENMLKKTIEIYTH